MGIVKTFKNRQAIKINARLANTAEAVTAELLQQASESPDGPYIIPAGQKPKRMYGSEYMDRLQALVIQGLGNTSLAGQVTYDKDATEQVSTEFVAVTPNHWTNEIKENLSIVFSRVILS